MIARYARLTVVALIRKVLTTLNGMLRTTRPWQSSHRHLRSGVQKMPAIEAVTPSTSWGAASAKSRLVRLAVLMMRVW